MYNPLTQRLVGAIVLLASAAILWPIVFDDFESQPLDNISRVPPEPAFEKYHPEKPPASVPVVEPRPDKLAETAKGGERSSVKPVERKAETSKVTPRTDRDHASLGASSKSSAGDKSGAVVKTSTAPKNTSMASAKGVAESRFAPPPEPAKVIAGKGVVGSTGAQGTKAVPSKVPTAKPTLDGKGVPESWLIQVGSFGDRNNADGLAKRLSEKGHKAFVRGGGTETRRIYRVLVGPYLDSRRAKEVNTAIQRDFGQAGTVIRTPAL